MEGGAGGCNQRSPEEVFRDFRGRRAGIVKALTTDVEKFYRQCDPGKVSRSWFRPLTSAYIMELDGSAPAPFIYLVVSLKSKGRSE
ncbi:hypothetical protein BHE74_00002422 [Ensete ventricosum]|uniref:PHD finger protein ALFIN-LIKE n=1 Tax=Ensete ventricosum TaxID=4639 RepID=A0A427AXP6_ENSVE|nr:hypothetical protein B296_00022776 [Ensete ventricosum]RWW28494.1 hypothetical protein GW17_00007036 [Ensete ventricosum]RWW88688.1 hypothetical protein BHE74_00002422 [Ensete ventricosum]RZS02420.1 hypothetical protein BHM03_00032468 [Ensete ventricosum]